MSGQANRLAAIDGIPVGTFHAVTVRDAASSERDGWPVYACRALDEITVEVLFHDGLWLLCAPDDVDVT